MIIEANHRIGDAFEFKKFVDIVVHIIFGSLSATKLMCFKKDTYELPLEKLRVSATHLCMTASKVGARTLQGNLLA